MPLDLDWLQHVRINRAAIDRRAATLMERRSVKQQWQAKWLLRAIQCMDLTTLAGDDTTGSVQRLCLKALNPLSIKLRTSLGLTSETVQVGAVCVYHTFVATAVETLRGSSIPVAAVSTGFPAGLIPLQQRLDEIRASVASGAAEIDVVISRHLALTGQWQALYDEVCAFRQACGQAIMKTILATGELGTLAQIARASLVCMMAGSDFIKTSTGKESINATLPVGLTMVRMIRAYHEKYGVAVGFKPAGGIRTAKQSIHWLMLMKEELDGEWVTPRLFRLGASTLLTDIERQLEYFVTKRYAAAYRQPST